MKKINERYLLDNIKKKYYLKNVTNEKSGFVMDKYCAEYLISVVDNTEYVGNLSSRIRSVLDRIFVALEIAKNNKNGLIKEKIGEFIYPLISVVILNYNGKNHIEDCVDSIINQKYSNYEIIIVDNASTDNSLDIIRKRYNKYSNIKLIILRRGVSFSEGNNIGIKKANGEYVLLINNDTKVNKELFWEISRTIRLNKNEKWGALALKLHFFYTPGVINSFGNSVRRRNWGYDNFLGFIDCGQFDYVSRVFSACFGAVVIRKSVYCEIGGLDKNYWFYYEDVDWSFRAQLAGYDIITCPRGIVYHKFSASSNKKGNAYKIQLAIRNRMYFVFKNMKRFLLWKFFINYLKEDLGNFAKSLINRDFLMIKAYIFAYANLVIKIPIALHKRIYINKLKEKNKNLDEFKIHELTQRHISPSILIEDGYTIINVNQIRRFYM